MTKKLIQPGNTKLGRHIYMFNIPATKEICGRLCKGCYAHKEQVRFPTSVLPAREERYEQTLQLDFSNKIISELSSLRKPPKFFRIHSSGEFYDQAYINKWVKIVKKFPNIIFYAYTKRMKDFDFSPLLELPNAVVINSFHYGRLNYGKLDKAPKDAFVCPDQPGADVQCGIDCTYCMSKSAEQKAPYFKQH